MGLQLSMTQERTMVEEMDGTTTRVAYEHGPHIPCQEPSVALRWMGCGDSELLLESPEHLSELSVGRAMALFDTSKVARAIVESKYPFIIRYVNASWKELCGFTQREAVGKTLKILQGPGTEKDKLNVMIERLEEGDVVASCETINYCRKGTPMLVRITSTQLERGIDLLGVLHPGLYYSVKLEHLGAPHPLLLLPSKQTTAPIDACSRPRVSFRPIVSVVLIPTRVEDEQDLWLPRSMDVDG